MDWDDRESQMNEDLDRIDNLRLEIEKISPLLLKDVEKQFHDELLHKPFQTDPQGKKFIPMNIQTCFVTNDNFKKKQAMQSVANYLVALCNFGKKFPREDN